jgi:hypothetical protein
MIYCIGLTARYEKALAGPSAPVKGGRAPDYPGGWVWQTAAGAGGFLARNGLTATHSVYAVEADWERDTEAVPGETYRRLIRNAAVHRIPRP